VINGDEKFQNKGDFFILFKKYFVSFLNKKICDPPGIFLNTRVRRDQAHMMHSNLCWSRADPGLKKSKSGKNSVFPKKKHTSTYNQQTFECICLIIPNAMHSKFCTDVQTGPGAPETPPPSGGYVLVIEETIDVLMNADLNAVVIYVKAPILARPVPTVMTPPTTSLIKSDN